LIYISLEAIVLAFAGTDDASIRNWIEDFNFPRKKPYSNCKKCSVHEGFYNAYESVQEQVRAAIKSLSQTHPTAKIIITGHSLGAALAVIAFVDVIDNNIAVPSQIYTFGQPRVGNKYFSSWVKDSLTPSSTTMIRVTHGHDPVPHLPPEMLGFRHTPIEVFYKGSVKDGYQVCDGSGEDKSCSDKAFFDMKISDHLSYMDGNLDHSSC